MDATNFFNQEFRTREQVEAETGFTIEAHSGRASDRHEVI
jgi:hypothetical protein